MRRSAAIAAIAAGVIRDLLIWTLTVSIALPAGYSASMLISSSALASAYSNGFDKYQQGDFAGAEKILKESLRSKLPAKEQASTLKLMGICQFMQNNKTAAAESFKSALSFDSSTHIDAGEVLDDAVLGFFNKIKSTAPSGGTASAAKGHSGTSASKSASKRTTDSNGNPLKQTFLMINSPNKGANITIDGIIAGQVNNKINTEPGKVLVEVSLNGYKTKKLRINIIKDQDNDVSINLEKNQPKARPKAAPQATPKGADDSGIAAAPNSGAPAGRPSKKRGSSNNQSRPKTANDDMFGEPAATRAQGAPGGGLAASSSQQAGARAGQAANQQQAL